MKRSSSALATLALVAATLLVAPRLARATGYNQAIYYKIVNKHSGRLLSVENRATTDGARNIIYDDVGADDQLWSIQDADQGTKKLINKRSGRALSTTDGRTDNGTIAHLWQYLGTAPDQDWRIAPGHPGYVKITSAKRPGAALSVVGAETANATLVQVWDDIAADDQDWTIVAVQSFSAAVPYRIINQNSGTALSVFQGGTAINNQVDIYDFINQPDQFWFVVALGGGYYHLVNQKSGRLLSLSSGQTGNGTIAILYDDVAASDQAWAIVAQPNGMFKLSNQRRPGGVLSILGAQVGNASRAQLFDDVSANDQYWSLVPSGNDVAVNALDTQAALSPTMTGAGLEDVNHEIYGGIYSQLVFGESFQEEPSQPGISGMWRGVVASGARGSFTLGAPSPFQGRQSQRITAASGAGLGVENRGLNRWGISFTAGKPYDGYVYLRSSAAVPVTIAAEGATGTIAGPGGTCVDVSGDDTGGNGAAVQLWACQPSAMDQRWTHAGDDTIRTLGRCLDIADNGTAAGAVLQLWDCNGVPGQIWQPQPDGSLRNPGSGRCVATSGGTANGTRLQIADCAGDATQQFALGAAVYAAAVVTTAGAGWARYDFSLTPGASDPRGRLTIKLGAPGTLDIGYAYLQPGAWGRIAGLPVRKDIVDAMTAQRVTVLRYGGSAILAPGYRWKHMIGARELRPVFAGWWYPFETNGWGILDFLDLGEAMGVLAIPTFNIDETPEDMADFVEYVNGSTATPWGARRAASGHPAPYGVHQIELGNEQFLDAEFAAKFDGLAAAIWAKDPAMVLTIGDMGYGDVIADPDHVTGSQSGITSLAAYKTILDFAAAHAGQLAIDVHIWTDNPEQVAHGVDAVASLDMWVQRENPAVRYKLQVYELNASRHNMERALANAAAIGLLSQLGNRVTVVTSANALQADGQNTNGWDQGLVFYDPQRSWLQPPGYVTQMIASNYLPRVVNTVTTNPQLTVTASTDGTELVIQVVNASGSSQTPTIRLTGYTPATRTAQVTQLSGDRADQNDAANPTRVTPQSTTAGFTLAGGAFTYTFAPSSVTILRLR